MSETLPSENLPSDDHSDLLSDCDPIWRRTVTRGLRNIIRSVILLIAMAVVGIVAFGIYFFSLGKTMPGPMATLVIILFCAALPSLVYIRGVWQFTTPEPSGDSALDRNFSPRRIARVCCLFTLVSLIFMLVKSNERGFDLASKEVSTIYMTLDLIQNAAIIMVTIGYIAVLLYLRKLAVRLPDAAMHRRIGVVIIVYALTYTLHLPFSFLSDFNIPHSEFASNSNLRTFYIGFLVIWGFSMLFHMAASIWAFLILFRAKNLFERFDPPAPPQSAAHQATCEMLQPQPGG